MHKQAARESPSQRCDAKGTGVMRLAPTYPDTGLASGFSALRELMACLRDPYPDTCELRDCPAANCLCGKLLCGECPLGPCPTPNESEWR